MRFELGSRRWLALTLLTTLVAASAVAGANARVDLFGLFRDPAGRSLPPFGDERIAKYLLGTRYVQANFDGILVGSSMSANWRVGGLSSARLFNESVSGGNYVEEKALVDRALERPGVKLALVVVHPYLSATHDFKTVRPSPREVWGALGSLNLLEAYKNALKIRTGRERQVWDETGSARLGSENQKLNEHLQAMLLAPGDFEVDPIALAAFRELVAALRAHRVPVAFVIPPAAEALLAPKREAFTRYARLMLAERAPGEPLLDFTSDELRAFRMDATKFMDGIHLHDDAAAELTAILDARVKEWISQGWLGAGARAPRGARP